MGREVRRVPPHWDHPKAMFPYGEGYQPMFDETFEHAVAEWEAEKKKFKSDPKEQAKAKKYGYTTYEEYAGDAPDHPEYYRPWKDEEATWYQLWETVTEGTPVSPPFATPEELIDYLAKNGDFSDQRDCEPENRARQLMIFGRAKSTPGWGYERAKAFVEAGWAPSGMIRGGQMLTAKDIPLDIERRKKEA